MRVDILMSEGYNNMQKKTNSKFGQNKNISYWENGKVALTTTIHPMLKKALVEYCKMNGITFSALLESWVEEKCSKEILAGVEDQAVKEIEVIKRKIDWNAGRKEAEIPSVTVLKLKA